MHPRNTKGGSITVPLTSWLTILDWSVLQIKTKIVCCHTADSKPVRQEVNGTVILPPLVYPAASLKVLAHALFKNIRLALRCLKENLMGCTRVTFIHSFDLTKQKRDWVFNSRSGRMSAIQFLCYVAKRTLLKLKTFGKPLLCFIIVLVST